MLVQPVLGHPSNAEDLPCSTAKIIIAYSTEGVNEWTPRLDKVGQVRYNTLHPKYSSPKLSYPKYS